MSISPSVISITSDGCSSIPGFVFHIINFRKIKISFGFIFPQFLSSAVFAVFFFNFFLVSVSATWLFLKVFSFCLFVVIGFGWRRWNTKKWSPKNLYISLQYCKKSTRRAFRSRNGWYGNNGWIWIWASYKPLICSIFRRRFTNYFNGRLWWVQDFVVLIVVIQALLQHLSVYIHQSIFIFSLPPEFLILYILSYRDRCLSSSISPGGFARTSTMNGRPWFDHRQCLLSIKFPKVLIFKRYRTAILALFSELAVILFFFSQCFIFYY